MGCQDHHHQDTASAGCPAASAAASIFNHGRRVARPQITKRMMIDSSSSKLAARCLLLAGCLAWLGEASTVGGSVSPTVQASSTTPAEPQSTAASEPPKSISRGPDLAADILPAADLAAVHTLAVEPRQYFKIHITPGQNKRRQLHRQALRRRATHQGAGSGLGGSQQPPEASSGGAQKPKISNATLKRLLNQSLMRAGNGSAPAGASSPKGSSNFKFVFMARAVPPTPPPTGVEVLSGDPKPTTPLPAAASVGRQLADALLSSAAQLVSGGGNSSSSSPFAALASHLVEAGSAGLGVGNNTWDASDADRRRRLLFSQASLASSINNRTRLPSKIYNLPVKFAGNGQLNSITVISSIKKHLANIKRLQQASSDQGRVHSQGTFPTANEKKRPQGTALGDSTTAGKHLAPVSNKPLKAKQQQHKLKGHNSRFIYLPLKYLSNARPGLLSVRAVAGSGSGGGGGGKTSQHKAAGLASVRHRRRRR